MRIPESNYFVFVSTPAVCVRQTLDIDGGVFEYVRYTASQLKSSPSLMHGDSICGTIAI